MLQGIPVIVILPTFNEAPRIARVLRATPPEVDHILLVDDASTDATCDAARAIPEPRLQILTHALNRGVGAAITTGYRHAQTLTPDARAAFVVMAGDGQMDPRDLPSLVDPIAKGQADYVKGNRFAWPGARRQMPTARWVGGWGFSLLTSAAIGQRVRDTQCGYTALASGASHELDLDDLWPRYGYPNDLLGQLAVRRLRIAEVPVRPIYADEVSRLRVRHLPRIASLVARAWVRRMRRPTCRTSP